MVPSGTWTVTWGRLARLRGFEHQVPDAAAGLEVAEREGGAQHLSFQLVLGRGSMGQRQQKGGRDGDAGEHAWFSWSEHHAIIDLEPRFKGKGHGQSFLRQWAEGTALRSTRCVRRQACLREADASRRLPRARIWEKIKEGHTRVPSARRKARMR
jgi:hypothetical protein